MSDREFVVSTRFYLNSFDFTQFNLNKGPFFNQNKNRHMILIILAVYFLFIKYNTKFN